MVRKRTSLQQMSLSYMLLNISIWVLQFTVFVQQPILTRTEDIPPYRDHRSDQSSPTMRFVDSVFADESLDSIKKWLDMKLMSIPGHGPMPLDVNFVNPISPKKENAAMYATRKGNFKLLKMLLEYGAVLNTPNSDDFTPIHVAATLGHAEVVSVIDDSRKVDFEDLHDDDGLSPVHRACQGVSAAHTKTVKVFLDGGVDINLETDDGYTLLDVVRKSGKNAATEKLLVERGAKARFSSASDMKEEL